MKTATRSECFMLAFLALFTLAQAQVPRLGKCPTGVQTVQDFDVNKYLGPWFEYSKYPFIFEFNGKCITAKYGLLADGNVSVYNYNINRLTSNPSSITGTARVVGPGKLSVQFESMPAFLGGSNYWVLGTDYNNYAVVYSCTEIFGIFHTQVVWILTRAAVPQQSIVDTATAVITANGLSLAPLQTTDQQNCPAST